MDDTHPSHLPSLIPSFLDAEMQRLHRTARADPSRVSAQARRRFIPRAFKSSRLPLSPRRVPTLVGRTRARRVPRPLSRRIFRYLLFAIIGSRSAAASRKEKTTEHEHESRTVAAHERVRQIPNGVAGMYLGCMWVREGEGREKRRSRTTPFIASPMES